MPSSFVRRMSKGTSKCLGRYRANLPHLDANLRPRTERKLGAPDKDVKNGKTGSWRKVPAPQRGDNFTPCFAPFHEVT